MEKVGKIEIVIVRKPTDFDDLMDRIRCLKRQGELKYETVNIVQVLELSTEEYDKIANDFLANNKKLLSHDGGFDENNIRNVIEVRSSNRVAMYIDREGYDYARYVGIRRFF